MGYVINQYNRSTGIDTNTFMDYIKTGTIDHRETQFDIEVVGSNQFSFYDECIKELSLNIDTSYYFHGKIRRMKTEQTFNIKLCYFDYSTDERKVTQFIKNITVASGNKEDWVDVEFIFTPLQPFDCLLFELQRTQTDFNENMARDPLILYEELSVIKNVLIDPQIIKETSNNKEMKLIKLGVQSVPGFLMCINKEEIHTGGTGIYEIKNGVITVSSFSVVHAAEENSAGEAAISTWVNEMADYDDGYYYRIEEDERIYQKYCLCLFNTNQYPKTRTLNGFTLDYMFKEVPINSSTLGGA